MPTGDRFRHGLSAMQFMAIRLIRLYPLYLLSLVISAIVGWVSLAHGQTSPLELTKNLIAAALFLPSPSLRDFDSLFPLNGPAWSLSFELLANLSLGYIDERPKNATLFLIVTTAAVALVIAVIGGLFGFGAAGIGSMVDGFEWRSIGAGCLRVAYSFSAGVLVYRVWSIRKPRIKVPHFVLVFLLVAILVQNPPEHYRAAFDLVAAILIFPLLIWFGASRIANGVVGRVFTSSGTSSYAVYVLHLPLYNLTLQIIDEISQANVENFQLYWGVTFVVFVFAVAMIADRFFDRPVRAMLMARFGSSAAEPIVSRAPKFQSVR